MAKSLDVLDWRFISSISLVMSRVLVRFSISAFFLFSFAAAFFWIQLLMCFTVFLGVSVSMDMESWGKLYLLKCKRGRSLPPFFRQYAIERMSLFLRNLFCV